MKDFFLSIYEALGLTGIIFLSISILILIIQIINTQHMKEIKELNRGIQNELQYQRQERTLRQDGRLPY